MSTITCDRLKTGAEFVSINDVALWFYQGKLLAFQISGKKRVLSENPWEGRMGENALSDIGPEDCRQTRTNFLALYEREIAPLFFGANVRNKKK